MPKKISEELKGGINKLYKEGLNPREIARQIGVSYYTAYSYTRVNERGFKSATEYHEHLVKKRKRRKKNKELSNLIKIRLEELDKNQLWLAEKIGVTPPSVTYYVQGMVVPTENIVRKLFSALKVPYKTLDGLIEDNYK